MVSMIAIGWSQAPPGSDVNKEGEKKKNGWCPSIYNHNHNHKKRANGRASEQISELFSHRA